jgi:hypothetical protein
VSEQKVNTLTMANPSQPTPRPRLPQAGLSQQRLRDEAVAALVPFFIDGAVADELTARIVAEGLLDDYKAATPRELQLSAQIIALGWASLACVSASIAVRDQSLEEMLRLQGYAIALDRLSRKSTKALEARRKERARDPGGIAPENTLWDEGAFRSVIGQAAERMLEAKAKLAAFMATLMPSSAPKLSGLSGEPMTPAVLARRRRA